MVNNRVVSLPLQKLKYDIHTMQIATKNIATKIELA